MKDKKTVTQSGWSQRCGTWWRITIARTTAPKNEYIKKAVQFYSGYPDAAGTDEYLPCVLSDVLEGKLSAFGGRIGRLLFKLAVEQNMNANILAALAETAWWTATRWAIGDLQVTHGGGHVSRQV